MGCRVELELFGGLPQHILHLDLLQHFHPLQVLLDATERANHILYMEVLDVKHGALLVKPDPII